MSFNDETVLGYYPTDRRIGDPARNTAAIEMVKIPMPPMGSVGYDLVQVNLRAGQVDTFSSTGRRIFYDMLKHASDLDWAISLKRDELVEAAIATGDEPYWPNIDGLVKYEIQARGVSYQEAADVINRWLERFSDTISPSDFNRAYKLQAGFLNKV